MPLLTINVGSSSVRLVGYDARERTVANQHLDLEAQQGDAPASRATTFLPHPQHLSALRALGTLPQLQPLEAVVHRVVHGGDALTRACRIDGAVEAQIDALGELAPLHNPPALAWIRASREAFPGVPQIAVFDTAFFASLPLVARQYALPRELQREAHVRRFGFHGLAHSYLWNRWHELCGAGGAGRLISLQLGSGCSVAAIRDGAPLDISMGFSPLEGLVMGSRCGDLDAGLLLYLQRRQGWSNEQAELYLNERCGLLGLSGRERGCACARGVGLGRGARGARAILLPRAQIHRRLPHGTGGEPTPSSSVVESANTRRRCVRGSCRAWSGQALRSMHSATLPRSARRPASRQPAAASMCASYPWMNPVFWRWRDGQLCGVVNLAVPAIAERRHPFRVISVPSWPDVCMRHSALNRETYGHTVGLLRADTAGGHPP